MTTDYRATVFLPRTSFPMRASLPTREPELLERWQRLDIYGRLRAAAAGREKFILHDGPPYANGHLHMGTALNKILKDVVNRSQQMLGKDAVYVPGWDCHGLPIEWQIEQRYRQAGKDKDAVPIAEFRRECREFAEHWIDVQRSEFKRLGVVGDWDHPYTTMEHQAEAGIYRELGKFLLSGQLYRGKKSVMWSVVEKTALAEAEVEYRDHTSTTIVVRFPVVEPAHPALAGASVVIWTTTPWTMPGNRAVAYGADIEYRVIEVTAVAEGSLARVGERLVLAARLVDQVAEQARISGHRTVADLTGRDLAGTVLRHPLHGQGYDFAVPLLAGDFVSAEEGTGFVHVAPSHGADDFELGARHGLEVPDAVAEDGHYTDAVPLFAGIHVFKAAEPVIAALLERGALLARGKLVHSYPHSWRSKAPLIFRATPQWFIPMDGAGRLREKALAAIEATRWVPPQGRNRIRGMVEARPDWCISRQRAWGVPIAVFVHKSSGEVLRDADVVERIARAFERHGTDAWYTHDPARVPWARARPRRLRAGHGHRGRLVRVRLDPCHGARAAARSEVAGHALSRGLRPASRLVPLVAARELRHARTRALRHRTDPRLRGRRRGAQDVQVARQRDLAARPDEDHGRRHPAPVDGLRRLRRGSADRRPDPGRAGRRVSPAAQHAPFPARQSGRVQRGGAAAVRAHAGAGAVGAASPERARPAGARVQRGVRLSAAVFGAAQLLRYRSVRLLLRRAQGCALLRPAGQHPSARRAYGARSAVPLLWWAGWRRSWYSPRRKPG